MPETADLKTVAFIGLGTMGREMSRNLLRAGYSVRVYDVNGAAATALATEGAVAMHSVAEVASGAEIAVTMLPDTPQVEEVALGPGGLRGALRDGGLYIDMSTISPQATRNIHASLGKSGIAMLDAPVSGGPAGAKEATLSIMAGGSARAFERAKPLFRAMGTTITHVGGPGAGQTMKLCNQLVCGLNLQAICEALALARASGVDLRQMREVLLGGSAASWMLDTLGPRMIEGDASAGFRIDLMVKDLRLVEELATEKNSRLPATALMTRQYIDAQAHGEGANGNQALFRVYDRMAASPDDGPATGPAGRPS